MVQLTHALYKYIPEWYHVQKASGSYFKKQNLFRMTRYYNNIGWSTHKNAMNRFTYYLDGEMYFAKLNSNRRRDFNRMRIAAGCEEHGYKYQYLTTTLPKLGINLNLKSLAQLSIYEPKTFQSLVNIARDTKNL